MIKLPDDYCLIKQQGSPKENVKAAYQIACERDNFTGGEEPLNKFRRSGKWIFEYIAELRKIEFDILDSSGIIGGAVESKVGDLKNLTVEQAAKLFFVTAALHHADTIKMDLIRALIAYGPKKFGPGGGKEVKTSF